MEEELRKNQESEEEEGKYESEERGAALPEGRAGGRRGETARQLISQLSGIDAVVFVAGLEQGVLARVTDQYFRDVGLEHIVQPGGANAFFQGQVQTAAQASDKLENRFR
jgi:hypothetical protein